MQKQYKLKQQEDNLVGYDLVNVLDDNDRIPAADDEFFIDEIYTQNDFEMKTAGVHTPDGFGSMLLAFRKITTP